MKLLDELSEILGQQHVLTGSDAAQYGIDWMKKYPCDPLAVLRPADTAQVSAIMKLASASKTPVVPISGNTGLVGGTHAPGALMISLERLNQIREIRPQSRIAIVQSGVILANLHDACEEHGLTFPLFFGARGSAMIGGNLSTNAGGSNVLRYGNTRALALGLEVVLPDGTIVNLMSELHKDNTGYDLKNLFIGAEGTLGIITAAVLKLVPKPRAYATAMVAVASLPAALTLLNRLQDETGGMVEGFEFMPRTYMDRLKQALPNLVPPLGYDMDMTILVELGATAPRDVTPMDDGSIPVVSFLEETLGMLIEDGLVQDAVVARSDAQRMTMWDIRESAAEIIHSRKPNVDTDVAVPLEKVDAFLETALHQLKEIDADAETITVSHLGDGNLHFTIWPTRDDAQLLGSLRDMVDEIATDLGGSFSAEHGIGLSKLGSMARLKDPAALATMHKIKSALDPAGIMNPGKVLP
ncbi:MAG: FAD-binding oxidoreductase [Marinosulfonomonas sp.]|nr:FAD-binding oxidoreductase [Marinosulfonomonas sp.]